MPSFILIHPTVWPHYTNVTDRQDRTDRQGLIGQGEPFYKRLPKMAEPIGMPFEIWTWLHPRKHVLGGMHTGTTWQILCTTKETTIRR